MLRPFAFPLLVILALWALAVVLVDPRGNFPLSDDWAYAHVVRALLDGRGFELLPWTGASVVFQALYGAAVCKLTGFSYEALRATTLAMSVLGIVSFHWMLRQLGAAPRVAAAATATVAFSPLWFHLSFTFMTEVPFAALAIAAAALYVRAFLSGSRLGLLEAGIVCAAAFLVRQHGIWIAVAAAMTALFPTRERYRSRSSRRPLRITLAQLLDAAAALGPALVAIAVYAMWATSADAPQAVHNKINEALTSSALSIGNAAFRGLATLGFLFWPWALTLRLRTGAEPRVFGTCFGVLAVASVFLLVREQTSMFYLTNVLGDFTVGALTTRDTHFLGRSLPPSGGPALHFAVTWLSLASASVLVARLWTALSSILRLHRAAVFCLLAFLLSALGTLVQAHYYFDRYLIALLPLAIAAIVTLAPPPKLRASVLVVLALLTFYSVAGTHDYMEWNRARWSMLTGLESRGIGARQIDGGFEYNAERLAAELQSAPSDAEARRGQSQAKKSWWWVVDDEWIIAFRELDGYGVADSRTFSRWLPPAAGRVLLLRREPASEPAAPPGGEPAQAN